MAASGPGLGGRAERASGQKEQLEQSLGPWTEASGQEELHVQGRGAAGEGGEGGRGAGQAVLIQGALGQSFKDQTDHFLLSESPSSSMRINNKTGGERLE